MFARIAALVVLAAVPAVFTRAAPAVAEAIDPLDAPHCEGDVRTAEDAARDGLSSADWSGIREAFAAGRHAAYPVEGGYQAHNPGQRWETCFDGRGFLVEPVRGGWSWGLELVSYGFPGGEERVTSPARVNVEGGRVAYAWDAMLTEWYVNDTRGLEHGYTLHRRPTRNEENDTSPLTFTLDVRGELRPELASAGGCVRFLDDEGVLALTYSGLRVFAADGEELKASFERSGARLHLLVEEHGARYPLTIDPIAQQAYLKASNTDPYDWFGFSVAAAGDTVVVGALLEESSATGVNGDQSDDSLPYPGAVYVFVRSGTSWSQEAYLKASNTDARDYFGHSVAISGDTVVIGAIHEDSNAAGVNVDQSDNSAQSAGAAYVFVRSGTSWSQQAYLKASNTDAGDWFGSAVSISGDTVVVGASEEASAATGVNGNHSDNSVPGAGAAYVFVRSGTSWSQQAYLKASNTDAGDSFGWSVCVSGDTVVIGAHEEYSKASGVDGDQGDNSAPRAGAAYVFVRNDTSWSQQAYLKASNTDANDRFGQSVAVSGDTVVAGAFNEASNATGVNGDQSDNSAPTAGAAYVFVRSGASWSQQAYLKASNTDQGDVFGRVSVSGDTLVVAASGEQSSATGVNGDQSDDSADDSGAAYVFARSGTSWRQQAYLKASNAQAFDHFGSSVAVSGDTLAVGALWEGSSATGVDGDQSDNRATQSGAAYVFDLPTFASATSRNDAGNTNPLGYSAMPPVLGGTWLGYLDLAPTGSTGGVIVGFVTALEYSTTFGYVLVNPLDPAGELLGLSTMFGSGILDFSRTVPNDTSLSGFAFATQGVSCGGPQGFRLHNAYDLVVGE